MRIFLITCLLLALFLFGCESKNMPPRNAQQEAVLPTAFDTMKENKAEAQDRDSLPKPGWQLFEDPQGSYHFYLPPGMKTMEIEENLLRFGIENGTTLDILPVATSRSSISAGNTPQSFMEEQLHPFKQKKNFKVMIMQKQELTAFGPRHLYYKALVEWGTKTKPHRAKCYVVMFEDHLLAFQFSAKAERYRVLNGHFSQLIESIRPDRATPSESEH